MAHFVEMSADWQITIPIEIRKLLQLKPGDKLLFLERNGQLVIANASIMAILEAQKAFAGAASDFGVDNPHGVQNLVDEIRYGVNEMQYGASPKLCM